MAALTTELEYVRPPLYPKQLAEVVFPKRYSLIEASTKAGKTSGCIAWIIEKALEGGNGHNFWWVAPVSSQAVIAFKRSVRALIDSNIPSRASISNKMITLENGAEIWFKSADHPDSLYGEDVYAAVIDEASRMKEEAFHAVRSTLTKTSGPMRIIGNVVGRKNWFYRMCRLAEKGDPDMGFHRITAPDAVASGVLAKEEIEDARRRYPEHIFKELYLAEAADDQGNPFGLDAIRECINPDGLSKDPPIVWGWDLGKHIDWTVGVALDLKGRVCRFERWQQIPWDATVQRILKITGSTRALVDSTGLGDPVLTFLQKRPLTKFEGFLFTPSSKQKLMEGLAIAITGYEVSFPAGPLVLELESFEYEKRPTGVRYSAPAGYHDDCVCALALAVEHWRAKLAKARYASLEWVG